MRRSSLARRARALAVLAGVAAAVPGRAGAVPAIAWEAPPGCPDAAALQAEVERLVGAHAGPTAISDIRARVGPRGDGWSLVVTLAEDGRTRERTLITESCEAAASTAAFVIAIAIDPAIGGLEVPPPPVPPPPEPAPTSEPRPIDPPPGPVDPAPAGPVDAALAEPVDATPPRTVDAPRQPRRPGPRGLLHAGPGLQVGMLPVGAGLTAAAGLLWPRLRVTLGYTRWFRTSLWTQDRALGSALSVHAADLRAGPVLRAGPLELPLHLGVELGALRAVGVGGDANFTRTGLWGAALAGLAVAWAPRSLRGRLALVVLAEAALALRRPRLVFNDDLEVGRVGPAAFRGCFLLEARFP